VFTNVVVINLDRRPDRWESFCQRLPADWPFPQPVRWPAVDERIDGNESPLYFTQCRGAWGCYQSHVAVLRWVRDNDLDKVLVLEDDCVWCDGFTEKAQRFLSRVPDDWQQLYLGGQHYNETKGLPRAVDGEVLRVFDVNRTHAYAVRADFAEFAYRYLTKRPHNRHIDYVFGEIHERGFYPVYAPRRWLVGQSASKSDVAKDASGRDGLMKEEAWWNCFRYIDEAGQKQMMR
jgi:hypothetical protein